MIRDAEKSHCTEISAAVKDLAGRAREKKLSPEEFQGGTITVIESRRLWHRSVRRHHQSAAGGHPFASAPSQRNRSWHAKAPLAVGERLWIGLSGDHRVVDGAVGARFLQALRTLIENPALMLV